MNASRNPDPSGLALRLIDDAWEYMQQGALRASPLERFPDISESAIAKRSETARDIAARIRAIDLAALPPELRLTLLVIAERAAVWSRQAEFYWTIFDPTGGDMYAMFAPTSYGGGWAIGTACGGLRAAPVATDAQRYRYLGLLADFAGYVDSLMAHTRGQIERGMFMPRVQAEAARVLLARLPREISSALRVTPERLDGHPAFAAEVDGRIAKIVRLIERFLGLLDLRYFASAGDAVGLANMPGGREAYRLLVRMHTSMDVTPEAVHELGLELMDAARRKLAAVRAEAGFPGDDQAYRAALDTDPAWRAHDAAGIAAFFGRYIDRFAPHIGNYFRCPPRATYGVAPLPDALTGSMTFGYFEAATDERPHGRYLFNTPNLRASGLFNIGPLCYHELVPGHHLQSAMQNENPALHPVRRFGGFSAYVEGWAEYANALADEIGLYREPAERFGKLMMEAFLICRLVVDTGMNALGWSLERARAFLRENSFMPEKEIQSETIRYACGIPGQALAYKIGDREFLRMRERMRVQLGDAFDIRDFHQAVLGAGALPISVLDGYLLELAAARK